MAEAAAGSAEPRASPVQVVSVVDGFGYGCVGADIHVFGNGMPLYLLENWRPPGRTDPSWLLELPSRMLNSRYAVVNFTGREEELGSLRTWRDTDRHLSARWLHAPGGQGKSRLAAQFAQESRAAGWKVVTAILGPGSVLPHRDSEDLRADRMAGVLLIVDYADRWPVSHLSWLFSNAMLRRDARVLLLARNLDTWPAIRASLDSVEATTSTQALAPLADGRSEPGARVRMFDAARDAFAAIYGVPADAVRPPQALDRPDFGLTLAVHMAALMTVDQHAHATSTPVPDDMAGLTAYLLERERRYWHAMYHNGAGQRVAPDPAAAEINWHVTKLARTAFVAALTGPLEYADAKTALAATGIGGDTDRALADHKLCYPPADPRTLLEPLYPDRLAEDYIALRIPGHDASGYPSDAWAHDAPGRLLSGPSDGDGTLPAYAARAITFLSAASERWPHLIATLETIEPLLPRKADGQLAVAVADLTERLARHRLPAIDDPGDRAQVYDNLGQWLDRADRREKAAAAHTAAIGLYRQLAAADPQAFEPKLARAALRLAQTLTLLKMGPDTFVFLPGSSSARPDLERPEAAIAALREAIAVFRRLASSKPAEYNEALAGALLAASWFLPYLNQPEDALTFAREAAEISRVLASQEPAKFKKILSYTLSVFAGVLVESQPDQTVELGREAVHVGRQLVSENPADNHRPLVFALESQVAALLRLGRIEEAGVALNEAAALRGRWVPDKSGRSPWLQSWSTVLATALAQRPGNSENRSLDSAVELLCRQGLNPAVPRQDLLRAFMGLQIHLQTLGRWDAALAANREVIKLVRSSGEGPMLNGVLCVAGATLARLEKWEEAATAVSDAAAHNHARGLGDLEACTASALATATAKVASFEDDGTNPFHQMARDEAVLVLRQFAETYRRLAVQDGSAMHEVGLAASLKVLSDALWKLGRQDEAIAAGQEQIRIWRRLAEDGTAEHLRRLGFALGFLAEKLTSKEQHAQADASASEAAVIWAEAAAILAEAGRQQSR